MRRRVRTRVLRSARTATRTFDLQLAIATLRLPALIYVELERFRTLPIVHGGNRADHYVCRPSMTSGTGQPRTGGNRAGIAEFFERDRVWARWTKDGRRTLGDATARLRKETRRAKTGGPVTRPSVRLHTFRGPADDPRDSFSVEGSVAASHGRRLFWKDTGEPVTLDPFFKGSSHRNTAT
jgi:hypothetical protein